MKKKKEKKFNSSDYLTINPRIPKEEVCIFFFQTTFVGQPKVAKRLYVICINHITHLFTNVSRMCHMGHKVIGTLVLVKLNDYYAAHKKTFRKIFARYLVC